MGRTFSVWCLVCGLAIATCFRANADLSDEQKKQLFLQAREDIRPVPRASASATPRPKPRTVATPEPTPTPKPAPEATPEPTPPKKPSKTEERRPAEKPDKPEKPAAKPTAEPDNILYPRTTPPQIPQATTPAGVPLSAPISIEKSGLAEDRGYEPAPVSSGGWFRRWKYLTPAVRRAIDQAQVQKGRWKYIIVHNSGTRQGNAHVFDVYHRRVRKMVNGLAYHFVIGNGSSSGNGEIEIGNRWTKQINGGDTWRVITSTTSPSVSASSAISIAIRLPRPSWLRSMN